MRSGEGEMEPLISSSCHKDAAKLEIKGADKLVPTLSQRELSSPIAIIPVWSQFNSLSQLPPK